MKLKIILILILLFLSSNNLSYCQTYSYRYKCIYNNLLPLDEEDKSDTLRMLKDILPVQLVFYYEIISNGKFMVIHGSVDSSKLGYFKLQASNSDAIIDILNKRIYFPEKKTIQVIKAYTLSNSIKCDSCYKSIIEEKDTSFTVISCKKIPKNILPPSVFLNANYGITFIKTPTLTIELLSYKKIVKPINFKATFETKKNETGLYEFLK